MYKKKRNIYKENKKEHQEELVKKNASQRTQRQQQKPKTEDEEKRSHQAPTLGPKSWRPLLENEVNFSPNNKQQKNKQQKNVITHLQHTQAVTSFRTPSLRDTFRHPHAEGCILAEPRDLLPPYFLAGPSSPCHFVSYDTSSAFRAFHAAMEVRQ